MLRDHKFKMCPKGWYWCASSLSLSRTTIPTWKVHIRQTLWSLYDCNKRLKKQWHRLSSAVTEMTLVNFLVTYSELYGKIPFLDFKWKVTQKLVTRVRKYVKNKEVQNRIRFILHTVIPPTKRSKGWFPISNIGMDNIYCILCQQSTIPSRWCCCLRQHISAPVLRCVGREYNKHYVWV